MEFIDTANQESYSSNFIKASLKKYIDIHFYDKLHYYCVVFLWICYVNNTIHRFKNKIANLSTINRGKKMSLGAWTRVDRVEVHHSNHKAIVWRLLYVNGTSMFLSLTSTERHCTGHWPVLYPTVRRSTGYW